MPQMPFEPGKSGNPAGKLKGTRNKTTLAVEALLDGEAETITRKAIELAKDGDLAALRLCLDRIAPPRKNRSVMLELPPVSRAADAANAAATLLEAMRQAERHIPNLAREVCEVVVIARGAEVILL
jgi:Family of unknown function (DUF5681)